MHMSKIVSLSDETYSRLSYLKKSLNASFSGSILYLLEKDKGKKFKLKDLIGWANRQKTVQKKENISENIDKILYGGQK